MPGWFDLQLPGPAFDVGPVSVGAHGGDAGIAHHRVGAAAGVALVQFMGTDADHERLLGGLGRCKRSRSEEHTSELQSLMRISYAVFCLKKKKNTQKTTHIRKLKSTYNTQTNT